MLRNDLTRVWVGGCIAVLGLCGCQDAGFKRVSDDVYVADSVPGLTEAAEKISSARKETQATVDPSSRDKELVVSINPEAGLGPEDFRIVIDERAIRVEGGGAGGAHYGALEMARTIREGRQPVALAEVKPWLPLRMLRIGFGIPGLPSCPESFDWDDFLDGMAAARFNVLVVSCQESFPPLVNLAKYPKAYAERSARKKRQESLQRFLQGASERNVRVILVQHRMEIPEAFFQHYAVTPEDRHVTSTLCRSFLREWVKEALQTYPLLRGIGVGGEALQALPRDRLGEFVVSVFAAGRRAARSEALLFFDAGAEPQVRDVSFPDERAVLVERDWSPGTDEAVAASASSTSAGRRTRAPGMGCMSCVRLPVRALSPSPPLLGAPRSTLVSTRSQLSDGIVVDLFSSADLSDYSRARSWHLLKAYGLSAVDPPIEASSWPFLFNRFLGLDSEELRQAASHLDALWLELANFHSTQGGWCPGTSSEREGRPEDARGIRDSTAFISLLEFVFTRTGSRQYLSIPELVASEVRGIPPTEPQRQPFEVADFLIEKAEAARRVLDAFSEASPESTGDGSLARHAARELEALTYVGEYHGRRIRAGIALMRFLAGLDSGGRDLARSEIQAALSSWGEAAGLYGALRAELGDSGFLPDLQQWQEAVADDDPVIVHARPWASGFRASPLVTRWPSTGDFDFRSLRGFLHVEGVEALGAGPVSLYEGGTLVELEDFAGNWRFAADLAGYSGEGFLTSGVEGTLAALPTTVCLVTTTAGPRQIWVRAAVGGGGGSPGIRIRMGDTELEPVHTSAAGTRKFTWERAGELYLSVGENYVTILDAGPGIEAVDALAVLTDPNWSPPTF